MKLKVLQREIKARKLRERRRKNYHPHSLVDIMKNNEIDCFDINRWTADLYQKKSSGQNIL